MRSFPQSPHSKTDHTVSSGFASDDDAALLDMLDEDAPVVAPVRATPQVYFLKKKYFLSKCLQQLVRD